MANTEFKIFAQLLATKYRKGKKAEEFTEDLFREIYLPEDEIDPIAETQPRTYRGYYYGQNDITELASQIVESLDKGNFAKYIETDSDETIEYLCQSFSTWSPTINASKYVIEVAKRFEAFINNAATPKTGISAVAVSNVGVPAFQADLWPAKAKVWRTAGGRGVW